MTAPRRGLRARWDWIRTLLPLIFAVSCAGTGGTVALQAKIADTIGVSANAAAPLLVDAYKRALDDCLKKSANRIDYDVCRAPLDHTWTLVRMRWATFKNVQGDYARALEGRKIDSGTPGLTPDDPEQYLAWLKEAWCDLKDVAPASVKIPPVPGLICEASK